MDRAEWNAGRKFEGGIFSGGRSLDEGQQAQSGAGRKDSQRIQMGIQGGQRMPADGYRSEYGCCCCGRCSRKKDNGQTALIVLAVAAIGALILAFLVLVLCMVYMVTERADGSGNRDEAVYEEMIPQTPTVPDMPYIQEEPYMPDTPYIPENPYMQEVPEGVTPVLPFEDWSGKTSENGEGEEDEYYTELQDAIRTDLSYTIEWKNYEYPGNSDKVMIAVDYPVIQGDVPNVELLNQKIAEETKYFEDYYAEYSRYMLPDEMFAVYSEGFVTYMDEKVMSVVFCESIYTDYWIDCGLYCLNFDMENGILLDNSSIMQIDDAFAVDFRMRSREQNGTIGELEYLSDQEVTHYLSNEGTSILFYTPLGMEVGLNYGESYVTVTYRDYEKYLQKY